MRSHLVSKLMLLGVVGGVAASLYRRRSRRPVSAARGDREPTVIPGSMGLDSSGPVEGLDEAQEFQISALGVEPVSEDSLDQASLELDTPSETTLDAIEGAAHDVGDLYGVHTPPAVDRTHPDDREAMDDGQTWLEALETSATEHGAEPEHELDDIVDDEEVNAAPHPSDTRDTPVADRGSGGPAGI